MTSATGASILAKTSPRSPASWAKPDALGVRVELGAKQARDALVEEQIGGDQQDAIASEGIVDDERFFKAGAKFSQQHIGYARREAGDMDGAGLVEGLAGFDVAYETGSWAKYTPVAPFLAKR